MSQTESDKVGMMISINEKKLNIREKKYSKGNVKFRTLSL